MINSKNLLTPNFLGNILKSNLKTKVKDVKKSFWFKGRIHSCKFFVLSLIRMMGYFRLGSVRVNECPAGSELPAGTRNRRKATVEINEIK